MKKFLSTLTLLLAMGSMTSIPSAQATNYDNFNIFEILDADEGPNYSTDLQDNLQGHDSIAIALILRVINVLSLLIGTFAFVVILYSGIMMVTAGGDENRIDRSKGILIQAIFGLVLAFSAYFIVIFVQSFFY